MEHKLILVAEYFIPQGCPALIELLKIYKHVYGFQNRAPLLPLVIAEDGFSVLVEDHKALV